MARDLFRQWPLVVCPDRTWIVSRHLRHPITMDAKSQHRADLRATNAVFGPGCDLPSISEFRVDNPLAPPKSHRSLPLLAGNDPAAKGFPNGVCQFLRQSRSIFLGKRDVARFGQFAGDFGSNADVPVLEVDVFPPETVALFDDTLNFTEAHPCEGSQRQKDNFALSIFLIAVPIPV